MRQAMRRAGITEPEIAQTLLVGYLQRYFYRRWATIASLLWFGLWFMDVFGSLGILIAGIVGLWFDSWYWRGSTLTPSPSARIGFR